VGRHLNNGISHGCARVEEAHEAASLYQGVRLTGGMVLTEVLVTTVSAGKEA
jgi:hypothetical protein